jgi:hypothetical protein
MREPILLQGDSSGYSGSETAVSAVVTLTIGKADAADAMKTAAATVPTTAKTNTLTLPTLPAGGAYGTPACRHKYQRFADRHAVRLKRCADL